MQLARVIGSMVSTRTCDRLEGLKLLVAVPIVLLFTRLQKYYVAGVTGGATKG